jgi:NAD(P)-dependent dehydrogenase (short-subunit alcohol dehydrogenase family)
MGKAMSAPAAVKSKFFGDFSASVPEQSGKTFAITGCTTGTGFVAAKLCAEKGAKRIIMLNRPSERATEATEKVKIAAQQAGSQCEVVHVDCDLMNFGSVRKAAAEVNNICGRDGGLDVLANNAGIMAFPDTVTEDGYDVQMQTNHLSHFLLTCQVMSSLEKAAGDKGSARVVQHSSIARTGKKLEEKYFAKHTNGQCGGDGTSQNFDRYQQTKLANAVFCAALKESLLAAGGQRAKVMSLVCHPGVSTTNLQVTTSQTNDTFMMNNAMKAFQNFASQSEQDGTMGLLTCMCLENGSNGKSAKTSDMTVTVESGDLWGPVGRGFAGVAAKLPAEINADKVSQENLWKWSKEATGIDLN